MGGQAYPRERGSGVLLLTESAGKRQGISLGSIAILTIVTLLTHENEVFFHLLRSSLISYTMSCSFQSVSFVLPLLILFLSVLFLCYYKWN